ncbi:hypothetical protein AX15_004262 [Amanita polypyramis BW_CC]|nr:hypothetical protein AX15_004262 [Amanita polypyramis BW_CC]
MPSFCLVCDHTHPKYTCSACRAPYVTKVLRHYFAFFFFHLPVNSHTATTSCYAPPPRYADPSSSVHEPTPPPSTDDPTAVLRPLTSLKWPYVPEESAYPDPLKRDDPKILQLHQYEAIATSPKIRKVLASYPSLKDLLTSIDKFRGAERDQALQKALGVTPADVDARTQPGEPSENIAPLRELAEAIEEAVRGKNTSALGLNWGDDLE